MSLLNLLSDTGTYDVQIKNLDDQISSLKRINKSEIATRDKLVSPLGNRIAKCLGYGVLGVAAMIGAFAIGVFTLFKLRTGLVEIGCDFFSKAGDALNKRGEAYEARSAEIVERERQIDQLIRKKEGLMAEKIQAENSNKIRLGLLVNSFRH